LTLESVGKERVKQALTDTAKFLDSINNHTLAAINRGESLNQVLHTLKLDQELLKVSVHITWSLLAFLIGFSNVFVLFSSQKPYLRPVYDDPHFIVHNLWRLYCGWWDFNPAHLRPVKDSDLSQEICQLTGGVEKIVRRVHVLADKGQLDLAVQLVEYALKADPNRRDSHEAAVKVYELKVQTEVSTMAKGIYRAAKADSEKFLAKTVKSSL